MDIDEARRHVAERDAELAACEAEVGRLATSHPGPVMITRMHALVEMVCAAQGSTFRNHYKLKLYKGVLLMLRQKGIQ
jgi:hypothetical protein